LAKIEGFIDIYKLHIDIQIRKCMTK